MFRTILGINPDPEKPGYEHVIIRPQPGGSLRWARGHYDSIRGRIAVAWRLEDNRIHLDVEIPVNTTATVFVPTSDASRVLESGRPAGGIDDIELLTMENNSAVYRLGSGRYCFSAPFSTSS